MKKLYFLLLLSMNISAMNLDKSTDDGSRVTLHCADVYDQQVEISRRFLEHSKDYVNNDVVGLLAQFTDDYNKNKVSSLDITSLSSRACIYLFSKIINYKLTKIDKDKYWKNNKNNNILKKDKFHTIFTINKCNYTVESAYDKNQPGTVFIKNNNTASSWQVIYNDIVIENFDNENWIAAKLLLDFEVARRLVVKDDYKNTEEEIGDDAYHTLPVITYLPYLVNKIVCDDVDGLSDFIVGQKESVWLENNPSLWERSSFSYDNPQSLFTGTQRAQVAGRLTKKMQKDNLMQNPQAIRKNMNCLCDYDENSEYIYVLPQNDTIIEDIEAEANI